MDALLAAGRWRAQLHSAMRGKRGRALLHDLIAALDAMPEKRLIKGVLEQEGSVCALGAVCKHRGVELPAIAIDEESFDDEAKEWTAAMGQALDIAPQLAAHVMYMNDEHLLYDATPEKRWQTVRDWAQRELERMGREHERKVQR
ncbi:MAG TPA: hypothetical protein VGK73_08930 [Polyangiaceae bacterium]